MKNVLNGLVHPMLLVHQVYRFIILSEFCWIFFLLLPTSTFATQHVESPHRKTVVAEPASHAKKLQPLNIALIGDSITEGYGVMTDKIYYKKLQQLLVKDFPLLMFDVDAISGSTTASAVERVKKMLATPHQHQGLMIVLAGNDLIRGVKPSVINQHLNAVIKVAEKSNVSVFLVQIKLPGNPAQWGSLGTEYEKIYQELSRSHKGVVTLFPDFLKNVTFQEDGIHPNEEGHQTIAENMRKSFAQWLQSLVYRHK